MAEVPDDVQRWTAKRRVALVLSIVRGETSVAEAARKHGLTVAEIEDWQDRLLAAAENALRSRPKDEEARQWSSVPSSTSASTVERFAMVTMGFGRTRWLRGSRSPRV